MKRFYRETHLFFIHFINVAIILCCLYILYEDYERVGHFQWVDENSIADGEELGLNIISVTFLFFGCTFIFNSIIAKFKNKIKFPKVYFIFQLLIDGPLYVYAALLIMISVILFIAFVNNFIAFDTYNLESCLTYCLLLLISAGLFFLGYEISGSLFAKNKFWSS